MKKKPILPAYLKLATQLYRSLDTPVALSCYILARHQEWDQLVSKDVDPHTYLDATSSVLRYRRDRQAVAFLRKSKDVPASFDRKKAAIEQFNKCETKCLETNYFLECVALGLGSEDPFIHRLSELLRSARKTIARVLGPVPPSLDGRFGPGTTFELEGSPSSTVIDKLHYIPHVTQAALPVWEHMSSTHHWVRRRLELGLPHFAFCRGNRFTTVPKDAKKDRGICIEPSGNLYAQLGIGSYLKRRLAAVGLFVNRSEKPRNPIKQLLRRPSPNGQTIHREIAEKASRDGSWSTIDLSDASDTVCYQIVRQLLPPDWFRLLDCVRSPFTRLPSGKWVKLEKFSSMGNGFTFELETLIFGAISCAVSGGSLGKNVLVYGDDILIPREHSEDVLAALKSCGFVPNEAKSFTTGLFRESCGGDFFCGLDVRPYHSEECPTNPVEWIGLHNQIVSKWPGFKHVHRYIREQVPKRFRVFGPSRVGDTVLHTHKSNHWRPFSSDGSLWITGVEAVPVEIPLDRWSSEFIVSTALLGVASSGIVPRNADIHGMRLVKLSIS